MVQVDPGAGTEETGRQLLRAHFKAEDGDGDLFVDGDMLGDVHREGGLSHRGTCRDDDHFARMQPVGHVVELLVACGDAGHLTTVLVKQFDRVERGVHMVLDLGEVAADAVLGHGEDLLLHIVDECLHVPLLLVTPGRRRGADGDHAAEEMLLPDDVDVVVGVGRRREEGLEIDQDRGAADLIELVPVGEGLGDRDQVDRAVCLGEFLERREDGPVGGMVEVLRRDPFLDRRDEGLPW